MELRGCGVLDTPLEPFIALAERRDPMAGYDDNSQHAIADRVLHIGIVRHGYQTACFPLKPACFTRHVRHR
jgi:hypothetical protein